MRALNIDVRCSYTSGIGFIAATGAMSKPPNSACSMPRIHDENVFVIGGSAYLMLETDSTLAVTGFIAHVETLAHIVDDNFGTDRTI